MRQLGLLMVLICGCAHHPAVRANRSIDDEAPPVAVVAEEPVRAIRLVAHRPAHYKFVGRVRATAPNDDFVLAAKQARAQLTRRAEALGADVVKIERVDPALHGQVLMAGRAYRIAD